MRSLKILVAEDHALMRNAIRIMLEQDGEWEIVGEAETGADVLPLVGRTDPDVLLLDMRLPGMDGFGVLERVRQRHPKVKVVVLSALDEPEQIAAALKRGASAYILKSINPADLASAVRQAVEGSVYSQLSTGNGESTAAKEAGLSEKELVVLKQLALGHSNREIAQALWISDQTVKFHLRNIYRKLGISNRTEALRYAYERHLVESPLHEQA